MKVAKLVLSLLGFALALSVSTPVLQAAPMYQVTNLGTFGGMPNTIANGINDLGQVTGRSTDGINSVIWMWSGGAFTPLMSTPTPLTDARAISNSGLVAGHLNNQAVIYDGGSIIYVTGPGSSGLDINNSGQVVGASGGQGYVYTNGVLQIVPVASSADARAINDNGIVVGYANGAQVGYIWDSITPGATPILYGSGNPIESEDINNAGQVVGARTVGGIGKAFIYENGVLTDLLAPAGFVHSSASGINESGQIVGVLHAGGYLNARAAIYDGTQWLDLNALIEPGSGWILSWAEGINENGWIIGNGYFGGGQEISAFVLTPVESVPEPSSLALLALGLAAIRLKNISSMMRTLGPRMAWWR